MPALHNVSEMQRQQMISDAAYYRAEKRGFSGGDPVADWLEAEAEVDARLRAVHGHGVLDRLDERLATVNEKLTALRKKVGGMTGEAREELKPEVDKLGRLRNSFKKRLAEIREHGEQASDRAQHRAEQVWSEISELLQRTSARRKTAPAAAPAAREGARQAASRKTESGPARRKAPSKK